MPDGAHRPPDYLPPRLVSRACQAFGVPIAHAWVRAAVNWEMFLRGDRDADPVEVANHYALWCFDKAYYDRFRVFDR